MTSINKTIKTLFANPRNLGLLVVVIVLMILTSMYFAADTTPETEMMVQQDANPPVYIFFKQDVTQAEMPKLLEKFGAKNCHTIAGGTHVFECTGSEDPDMVMELADQSSQVFDAFNQETVL